MAAYTLSSRFIDITNFAILMLVCVAAAELGLVWVGHDPAPLVKEEVIKEFKINEAPVFYVNPYYHWDQATIMMTLYTDPLIIKSGSFSSGYFYIEAEFTHPQKKYVSNMVVYDQLFSTATDLNKTAYASDMLQSKYPLKDIHNKLRGATVKFTVMIECVSIYGIATRKKLHEVNFTMPANYTHTYE